MDLELQTPSVKMAEKEEMLKVDVLDKESLSIEGGTDKQERGKEFVNKKPDGRNSEETGQVKLLQTSIKVLNLNPVVSLSKIDVTKAKRDLKMESLLNSADKSVDGKKRLFKRARRFGRKRKVGKTTSHKKSQPQSASGGSETFVTAPMTASKVTTLEFSESDFFKGTCRVCSEKSDKCADIFDRNKNLDRIINKFLPISVSRDDKQPPTVCKGCLTVLMAVNNLSLKCASKCSSAQEQLKEAELNLKLEAANMETKKRENSNNQKDEPLSVMSKKIKMMGKKKPVLARNPVGSSQEKVCTSPVIKKQEPSSTGIEILNYFSLTPSAASSIGKGRKTKHIVRNETDFLPLNTHTSTQVLASKPFSDSDEIKLKKSEENLSPRKYVRIRGGGGDGQVRKIIADLNKIDDFSDSLKSGRPPVNTDDTNSKSSGSLIQVSDVRQETNNIVLVDCNQNDDWQLSHYAPLDSTDDINLVQEDDDDSEKEESLPPLSKIYKTVSRELKINRKAVSKLSKERQVYEQKVNELRKSIVESKDKNEETEQENEERKQKNEETKQKNEETKQKNKETNQKNEETKQKNEVTKEKIEEIKQKNEETKQPKLTMQQRLIEQKKGTVQVSKKECSETVREKKCNFKLLATTNAKDLKEDPFVAAHDVSKLLDINNVTKRSTISQLHSILQLIKKYLKVKVLIPRFGAVNDVETLNALQLSSQNSKQLFETSVEVYSNVIKDTMVPVYYCILNESYASEKVKASVHSTIMTILDKQKKEALAKLKEENGGKEDCRPTIFKRLKESLKAHMYMIKCVDCNKSVLTKELLSHAKFAHLHQCTQCKMVKHSVDALEQHIYTKHVHTSIAEICTVCKRRRKVGNLQTCDHYFNCSVCGLDFFNYEVYLQHEKEHFDKDFMDLLYRLKPGCRNSVDIQCILSDFCDKLADISLMDFFWDKETFPTSCFLTPRDKLFCIRCFKLFKNKLLFLDHICRDEDERLKLNFSILGCVNCRRRFRTRSMFLCHYVDCVGISSDHLKDPNSDSHPLVVECALCSSVFQNFGEFNNHTESCFDINLTYCPTSQVYRRSTVNVKNSKELCGTIRESLNRKKVEELSMDDSDKNSHSSRHLEVKRTINQPAEPMVNDLNNPVVSKNNSQGKPTLDTNGKPESEEVVHGSTVTQSEEVIHESTVTESEEVIHESVVTEWEEDIYGSMVTESEEVIYESMVTEPEEVIHESSVTESEEVLRGSMVTESEEVILESTVTESKGSMDTLLDDMLDSFSDTVSSKETKSSADEIRCSTKADSDIHTSEATLEETNNLDGDVPACKPTVCSTAEEVMDQDIGKNPENNLGGASVEKSDFGTSSQSAVAETVCKRGRIFESVDLTWNLSNNSNNNNSLPETNASHVSSSTNDKQPTSKRHQYVVKRFTVKILTKSSKKGAVQEKIGVSTDQPKSLENQDPNTNKALIEMLSNKASDLETGGTSDLTPITVSYSLYFNKIDGELVLHHFSLAKSDLPQETKYKACSVIRTLLKKEYGKKTDGVSKGGNLLFGRLDEKEVGCKRKRMRKKCESKEPQKPSNNLSDPISSISVFDSKLKTYAKPTRCYYCDDSFKSEELLEHNLKLHMFRCETCCVYLGSANELLNHLCIVHRVPHVTCSKCFKKFREGEDASSCTHEFRCSMCSRVHHNWLEYLDHELIESLTKANRRVCQTKKTVSSLPLLDQSLMFPCFECGRRFAELKELENCGHNFKCERCDNLFNNYHLLLTHGCGASKVKMQRGKRGGKYRVMRIIHICPICNDLFDSIDLYNAHYALCKEVSDLTLDGDCRVKCAFCYVEFDSAQTFRRHHFDCQIANAFWCKNCKEHLSNSVKEDHTKECSSNVLCANCGLSFVTRTSYKLHLRQLPDGTATCKIDFPVDADGSTPEPDAGTVAAMIRDKSFDLKNCMYCGKIFETVTANIRHIKVVHLDCSRFCPVCRAKVLRCSSAILSHRKIHTSEEIMAATIGESVGAFKCSICDNFFNSSHQKLLHEIYYHNKELYQCSNCSKDFIHKSQLESHRIKCTLPKKGRSKNLRKADELNSKYKCKICDEPFEKLIEVRRHLKTHGGRISCDICKKTFLTNHIMRDHQRRKHFGTPSTCEICGVVFQCLKNMKEHQRRVHLERMPVICEICGSSFKTPKQLRIHKTLHTGVKPHSCPTCGMKFRLRSNLIRHQNLHLNEKTFFCQYCPAKFIHPNTFQLHQRGTHPEKYKFKCKNCNYGYNDEKFFEKHVAKCKTMRKIRGHTRKHQLTTKNGKCLYCNEEVTSLRLHLLRSTDTKPFRCKTCPKKFSYLCSLKNHEQKHLNNNKHKCKRCGETFLGLKQHTHHMQLKHNDTFPLHCSHCSRGYNEGAYYDRHILKCNEFTQAPKYNAKSKKLIPSCTLCNKVFNRFSDLNVHSAIVHKCMSYKKYQCQICNSMFASSHLLVKHYRYHYKDRINPGSFRCPKCHLQDHEFKFILDHNCPFALKQDGTVNPLSSPSVARRKSPRNKSPATLSKKRRKFSTSGKRRKSRNTDSETEDEEDSDESDFNDFDGVNDINDKDVEDSASKLVHFVECGVFKTEPLAEEVILEEEDASGALVSETVSDSSNFVYHCSFCKVNFDTLLVLQNHLHVDHGFDLDNLEFQII